MLPRSSNSSAAIDRPGRLQRVTTRAVFDEVPTTGKPTQVPDDEGDDNDNIDLYLPPSPPSRSIKRRGYSTRDQGQNKKQKGDGEQSADNVDALSSRSDRAFRGETSMRRHDRDSYHSPPVMQPEPSRGTADMRNFPNVTPMDQPTADADDAEDIVPDAPAFTGEARGENMTQELGGEDGDSVQGTEEVLCVRSRPSSTVPESVRPVEPLRLTSQSKDTQDLTRRLASNLLNIIPPGLDQANLPLISSAIDTIESLSKVEHTRLQDLYTNDFNSHRASLDQFIQWLKCLVKVYNLTQFQGNIGALDTFLNAMSDGSSVEAMKIFAEADLSLSQWRSHEDFVRAVTSVLSNLVRPWRRWNARIMEPLIVQFIEELLAWLA
jgi:hypothetical protein